MADRDEAESSVLKRGDGVRQRAQTLAALLLEEKALTAKLKAASEEGGHARFGPALFPLGCASTHAKCLVGLTIRCLRSYDVDHAAPVPFST